MPSVGYAEQMSEVSSWLGMGTGKDLRVCVGVTAVGHGVGHSGACGDMRTHNTK